jgi:hypothetical protein
MISGLDKWGHFRNTVDDGDIKAADYKANRMWGLGFFICYKEIAQGLEEAKCY